MTKYPNVLIRDIRRAIDNDEYMWIVVWGPARTGKSTLCLLILYWIYRSWDKVLDAIVFDLNQLMYKLKRGVPERWWTKNHLHNRVPCVVWDDFATRSGKAKTQHEVAWDYFKGAFDAMGTKLGVLIANMVSPTSPTQQLTEKYTHEIWVPYRGHAKYDAIRQQQDYRGFRQRSTKDWITEFDFGEVPISKFKLYDEQRCSLADEVFVAIEDVMATTETEFIMKRLQPMDINLLQLIEKNGPIPSYSVPKELGKDAKDAVVRLKARGLIVPKRTSTRHYSYDTTDLGATILKVLREKKQEELEEKAKVASLAT